MIDYAKVLIYGYSGSEWTLEDNNLDTLVWLSSGDKPSKTELDAIANKMNQEIMQAEIEKAATKQALLDRLGITADEAKLLLS